MYIYNICIIYHIPCIIFETFPYTQMLNNLGMFFLASIFEVGWCFPLFSKRIWNAPHLDIPWNGLLVASFHHKVFLGEPRKTLPYHKFWICWLCKNGESFWPSKNFQKTMAISKWPWNSRRSTGPDLGRASAGLCGTTGDNLLRFLQGSTSHMEDFSWGICYIHHIWLWLHFVMCICL